MKRYTLSIILVVLSLIVPVTLFVKDIQFTQQCEGYLKQAADANTVELASDRLDKAIKYAEDNGLTTGYTSVVYKTEDENIGFWYDNLKACQKELKSAINASQLEKSNVLMKVRESLTDEGEKGTDLTIPDGLYKYPNNAAWAIVEFISLFVFLGGLIMFICAMEDI